MSGFGFFFWWLREVESTLIQGICGPRGQDAEHHPFRLQLLPQGAVILDDHVLHDRHTAGAIEVRVGVAFLRLAMGGPAGVADAAHECCQGLVGRKRLGGSQQPQHHLFN